MKKGKRNAMRNTMLPTYICDRKACGKKCTYPVCYQTTNRKHSVTFRLKRKCNALLWALILSWVAFLATAMYMTDIWRFF